MARRPFAPALAVKGRPQVDGRCLQRAAAVLATLRRQAFALRDRLRVGGGLLGVPGPIGDRHRCLRGGAAGVGARDVEKAAPGKEEMVRVEPSASKEEGSAVLKPHKKWIWWSTDPKFWHELGFLASFTQLIAASVFWISGSVYSLLFYVRLIDGKQVHRDTNHRERHFQ